MAIRKIINGSDSSQEKKYNFSFTLAEVIGLCAGCVGALCAFFILGILLGRGYQPENDVPELAMMMPTQSANSSGEVKGGILKPEELLYMDNLKIKPETSVKPETAAKPEAKPAEKEITVKPETKVAPEPSAVKKDVAVAAPVKMDNSAASAPPVFDYLYQVASFGSESKAREFSGKLITDGLNASLAIGKSGSKTWYRVVVRHIGSAESTQSMRNVLAKYGIKKLMLKSKKAVK
ncbi:SPOR domain-containing protein [Desulfovibrio gilichinskyi]|uniref:Sporulation related domain-containing protein n=1 Tax=Desulfovibrio gilichinskyi TaxID=1519643 RepID=A0A1X7EGT4_9BACT|nr:SPOR domain-containing protein [Desulfovibrio gilichinskyi]SMF33265.1 Sporulation related domain-containing protein [Desulfovibrio gilichinskyi]